MLKNLNSYNPGTIGRIWYYLDNYCGSKLARELLPNLTINDEKFVDVKWVKREYTINNKTIEVIVPIFNFVDEKYNGIQDKMIDSVTIHLTEVGETLSKDELKQIIEKYDTCKNIRIHSIDVGSSKHEKE